MSQLQRLSTRPPDTQLAPLSAEYARTFLNSTHFPAVLPGGSRVYRYGSTVLQLTSTRQLWLNVTEDCFDMAEDVISFCSLLDMTASDHGERNPNSGQPLTAVAAPHAWNTGALRGELVVLGDLNVWAGRAAPMAFDRRQGVALSPTVWGDAHSTTPGGASQILIRAVDRSKLSLQGNPAILPRVRVMH